MSNRPYTWTGKEETHAYDDIIELPHYVSVTRPHMSMIDRAAQFSPFDALTGYDESISEEGRLTTSREELSEQQMEILNEKIFRLSELCAEAQHDRFSGIDGKGPPIVTITYFVPDSKLHKRSKKDGGAYLKHTGAVKRIDMIEGKLFFQSEKPGKNEIIIPTADIVEISGDALDEVDRLYE